MAGVWAEEVEESTEATWISRVVGQWCLCHVLMSFTIFLTRDPYS